MKISQKTKKICKKLRICKIVTLIAIFTILAHSSCGERQIVEIRAKSPSVRSATVSECPNGGVAVNDIPICNGQNGVNGTNGIDGVSIGVSVNTATCSSPTRPGYNIEFFKDLNNNGTKDLGEIIISTALLCDGASAAITVVPLPVGDVNCPAGGASVNGVPVCNGLNAISPVGSNVFAVKLCPADNSTYPEYGLFVGGELYAVFYGNASSHPHQIGLTRLPPGTYITTIPNPGKIFTYTKSGSTATLTCESVSVTYDLTTGDVTGGPAPSPLTGVSCLIKLINNFGSEKHYSTTVSGSGIAGDYQIDYVHNNNSYQSTSGGCFSNFGFWTNNNCLASQYSQHPGHVVRFTPISGAMNYMVYIRGNSILQIQSAVLRKISTGQTVNCVVDNSL